MPNPAVARSVVLVTCLLNAFGPAQDPARPAERRLPTAPRVIWRIDKPSFRSELAVHRGKFWIGGSHLTCHDVHTGAELHRAAAVGPWWQPIESGGLIFVRHRQGTLHAFVPELSRELWQLSLTSSRFPGTTHGDIYFAASGTGAVAITGGEEHWRTDLGSPAAMTPATDGERVYVGTADGFVVGLDLHTGKEIWRYESGAEFGTTSPVVDRGVLFLADRGVRSGRKAACNAFDAATGKLLWSTQFGATGFSKPHPHGDRVWAGFGVRVASFDRRTGELDREHAIRTGSNAFGLPGVVGDVIAFGNLDGNFYVHDLATGALRWRLDVTGKGDPQVAGWALHEGVLVVSTTKGMFGIGETPGAEPAAAGFVLRPPQ